MLSVVAFKPRWCAFGTNYTVVRCLTPLGSDVIWKKMDDNKPAIIEGWLEANAAWESRGQIQEDAEWARIDQDAPSTEELKAAIEILRSRGLASA